MRAKDVYNEGSDPLYKEKGVFFINTRGNMTIKEIK